MKVGDLVKYNRPRGQKNFAMLGIITDPSTKGIWKVQWVDGTHSVHHHCWIVVIRETV